MTDDMIQGFVHEIDDCERIMKTSPRGSTLWNNALNKSLIAKNSLDELRLQIKNPERHAKLLQGVDPSKD